MFDIEVTAPILVTDFDINLSVGNYDIEICRPAIVVGDLFTQGTAFGGGPNAFDAQTSNEIKVTLGDF